MKPFVTATFGAILLLAAQDSTAWSQGGHMVSGAIAYDQLRARDPRLIDRIMEIMAQHPDRGSFQIASAGAAGEERARRIFMEMARWPDDIRGGMYDHPTWHYADRPLLDPQSPPPTKPREPISGQAMEAFSLNAAVVADTRAPAPDRAIALCWLFHIVGDMHQPLHAADWRSATYPKGDRGGSLQYVLDPQSKTPLPMSLHWYWDQAVQRNVEPDAVAARARELEVKIAKPARTAAESKDRTERFRAWVEESFVLAKSDGYRSDLKSSPQEKNAPPLSSAYVARSTAIAEERLTLASYRLADLLEELLTSDK